MNLEAGKIWMGLQGPRRLRARTTIMNYPALGNEACHEGAVSKDANNDSALE